MYRKVPHEFCYADGCDRKAKYADGLCKMHHLRMYRYGRLHTIVNRGSGYTIHPKGYVYITVDGKAIAEHVHLAEKALGKKLPKGAEVHHMNNIPWDNHTPFNLVVCQDSEYHKLLHKRAKALGYENY